MDEQSAKEEVNIINALSSTWIQEVLTAARRSLCYWQSVHVNIPFLIAISLCNKYQTMPELVSELQIVIAVNAILIPYDAMIIHISIRSP